MPVPQEREAIERHLMRDTAYQALCDAIVGGTLAPGETLHDGELCDWLGLSRTPVRGALAKLEDVGLIETAPQRFTRVTLIEPDDAGTLFPVLAALHALATELAVPRLARADLERLRHENDLHIRALESARSRRRLPVRQPLPSRDGRHLRQSGDRPSARPAGAARCAAWSCCRPGPLPGRRSLAQHEAIIARAATGDAPRAASATRENWLELGAMIQRSLTG